MDPGYIAVIVIFAILLLSFVVVVVVYGSQYSGYTQANSECCCGCDSCGRGGFSSDCSCPCSGCCDCCDDCGRGKSSIESCECCDDCCGALGRRKRRTWRGSGQDEENASLNSSFPYSSQPVKVPPQPQSMGANHSYGGTTRAVAKQMEQGKRAENRSESPRPYPFFHPGENFTTRPTVAVPSDPVDAPSNNSKDGKLSASALEALRAIEKEEMASRLLLVESMFSKEQGGIDFHGKVLLFYRKMLDILSRQRFAGNTMSYAEMHDAARATYQLSLLRKNASLEEKIRTLEAKLKETRADELTETSSVGTQEFSDLGDLDDLELEGGPDV